MEPSESKRLIEDNPSETIEVLPSSQEFEVLVKTIPFAHLEFKNDIEDTVQWLHQNPDYAENPEYSFERFLAPAMRRLTISKVTPLLEALVTLNPDYVQLSSDVLVMLRNDPSLGMLLSHSQPLPRAVVIALHGMHVDRRGSFLKRFLHKCTTCEPWDSGIQEMLDPEDRKHSMNLWSIQYARDELRLKTMAECTGLVLKELMYIVGLYLRKRVPTIQGIRELPDSGSG